MDRDAMSATALYQGAGGLAYWQRNRTHVLAHRTVRAQAIRSLLPRLASLPWCEIGCGVRANLQARDCGIDIDRRLTPTVVASAVALPLSVDAYPVVFCVGLLMHLPHGEWQQALTEMTRVARRAVIIGEYLAPWESDRHWNPCTGTFGDGPSCLVWTRSYTAPPGWRIRVRRTAFPTVFGSDVTFLVLVPCPTTAA